MKPIVLILIVGAGCFVFGRYSAPDKIKIETKIETKYVERSEETKERDKSQVTTRITKPNGTVFERTRVVSSTRTEAKKTSEIQSKEESKKTIEKSDPVYVGLAGKLNIFDPSGGFKYGMEVSRQIFGPIGFSFLLFTDLDVVFTAGVKF